MLRLNVINEKLFYKPHDNRNCTEEKAIVNLFRYIKFLQLWLATFNLS